MDISNRIIEKLKESNQILQDMYSKSHEIKESIRHKLTKEATLIRQMQKLGNIQMKKFFTDRKLAGTDGSVNQTSGEPPHVIYFFQAVAKTTDGIDRWESDLYIPLIEKHGEEEGESIAKQRARLLAKLELKAAYRLIEEEDIALMLMDGALYHYRIDAKEEWESLRQLALKKNTLLVGVSEEITTENLIRLPSFEPFAHNPYSYDKDLLFGVLQRNELVYLDSIQHKAGLISAWMRLGSTPVITGFDMLEEQQQHMEMVSDMICTLTPQEGRGIPLWLDHIDKDIRITDKLVDGLIEQYVDQDVRRQLFVKMRQERPY